MAGHIRLEYKSTACHQIISFELCTYLENGTRAKQGTSSREQASNLMSGLVGLVGSLRIASQPARADRDPVSQTTGRKTTATPCVPQARCSKSPLLASV